MHRLWCNRSPNMEQAHRLHPSRSMANDCFHLDVYWLWPDELYEYSSALQSRCQHAQSVGNTEIYSQVPFSGLYYNMLADISYVYLLSLGSKSYQCNKTKGMVSQDVYVLGLVAFSGIVESQVKVSRYVSLLVVPLLVCDWNWRVVNFARKKSRIKLLFP